MLHDYQMEQVPAAEYELDYLITPELGGAASRENLWPQPYAAGVWSAAVKDDLERLLPQMVCDGRLDLRTAQQAIASDWIAAYKTYFNTDRPRPQGVAAADGDDRDGVFVASAEPTVVFSMLGRRGT